MFDNSIIIVYFVSFVSIYIEHSNAPVITSPDETAPHRIASEINTNASITLQVYSNSGDVKVSVFKVLNDSRGKTSVGSVNMSSSTVHLLVFNRKVPIEGTLINISILMETAEDFGLYEAIVSNAIGNRALRMNVEAQDKVSSESSSKAGVIAGSIVGGLVGLCVVVMTVVALRKYELIFNCKCVRKPESTGKVLYEASAVSAINNVEYESLGNRNDIRRDQPEINTRYNDNALGTNAYETLDANQSSKYVYSELGRQTGKGKTRPYENTAVHLDSGNAVYVNTTFENA